MSNYTTQMDAARKGIVTPEIEKVGGLERVYEIGRVFRNEGLDTRHNPEFTYKKTPANCRC